ncbi:MAG: hypothetical protein JWN89_631 [Parcubacteria group bacterium]|nr:hypothetical protein [Parcubacteria group bacterium]
MKQKTFNKDGVKRIICTNCAHYMGDSHLGEKNIRKIRCTKCHTISIVYPPRKDTEGGMKVIRFGPNEGVFTADLTESEIENSI